MNFYNSRTMKDSPAIAGFNVLPAPFVLCRSTLTLDHPHFSQALSKASRLEQLGLELSRRTLKSHCPTLSRLLSPMARFLWLAGQDNQGEIAFFAFCEDLVCPSYSDEVETSSKFNKKILPHQFSSQNGRPFVFCRFVSSAKNLCLRSSFQKSRFWYVFLVYVIHV